MWKINWHCKYLYLVKHNFVIDSIILKRPKTSHCNKPLVRFALTYSGKSLNSIKSRNNWLDNCKVRGAKINL